MNIKKKNLNFLVVRRTYLKYYFVERGYKYNTERTNKLQLQKKKNDENELGKQYKYKWLLSNNHFQQQNITSLHLF